MSGVWVAYTCGGTVYGIYGSAHDAVLAHGEDGYMCIKFHKFGEWSPS